ncbi:MAG: tRNA (adenosine(37)-N6)-threonylcarbamoyltransferase complex dimerization subunit type 1 TsaB [Oscillospiraceae bacterium]|nr:tRNA (adenosine(37)-N6)-threonylcarbamoyltransferase complex dimerization subunit type 1 TsaB [Oscillospiraceae bacterium]
MKILALESSAKAASVAITDGGKFIAQYYQANGLTHSRTLMAMTEHILRDMDMTIAGIDGIAVAAGPGSFTGIRIGVAAAKGLAWGAEKPICPVSTLEAMANQCYDSNVVICPVMDARRQQIYNAKFRRRGESLQRMCPDRAISIEELINEAKEDNIPYFLVGDGAELCAKAFFQEQITVVLAPENIRLQSAYGVAMAAAGKPFVDGASVEPNYLRLSQAERERLEKLNANK